MLADLTTQSNGVGEMRNLFEKETATLLGVSVTTLKKWRGSGYISFYKGDGETSPVIYDPAEVERVRLLRIELYKKKLDRIQKSVYAYLES